MTDLRWDHTVHYVNDLTASIAAFTENGLIARSGGSHTEWGTYNALSYFGLSYIEFLAIEHPQQLASSSIVNHVCQDALTLLPKQQILSRVALRTNNIDRIYASLANKNLQLSQILQGKRVDTQGRLIEWRMFTIGGDINGLPYPFIIQWGNTDENRLTQLRQQQIDVPHPAGDVNIQSAIFKVSQPALVAARWNELFGLALSSQDPSTIEIAGQQFYFQSGTEQRLVELRFNAAASNLNGKVIQIGQGNYQF